MAIKYPDRIESNNPLAYGIIKATEIAGQRLVKQLSDLYKLPDAILSESKTGEDAEGLIWIVGKDLYQLISWLNRNNASGWLKVIPFNEKMFDRFYNLDGNMINSLTGYIKATELLNLLENDSLLNALGKLEYKADLTYDLITSVYEGVHTIEELREMLKILEEIQNSSEVLNSYLSKYLPLTGGIMNGSIDMNKNSLKNAGFEVVTALPTTNLFVGRQVTYEGKLYTYNNEWLNIADDLGGKPETHEENFVYQPTASDLSIKDGFANIKKLKGNTLVWNQKFINKTFKNNGVNITTSEDVLILNGTLNNTYLGITSTTGGIVKIPLNHIGYYRIVIVKDDSNILQNKLFGLLNRNIRVTITQNTAKFLYQNTNDSQGWGFGISKFSGGEVFEDVQIKANVFDLTQMFGEGNEPTIEEFEAMFPNDYYEYNEGELMSFDGKGIKSVGFNLFDKSKVLFKVYINAQGQVVNASIGLPDNAMNGVSDWIKVFPNTNYFVKNIIGSSMRCAVYDAEKNYITSLSNTVTHTDGNIKLCSKKITTPNNARYIRFGVSDKHIDSICINLSHSGYRDGDYEPYEDYTLSFQDGKTISQLTGKLNGEGESVVIFPDGLRSAGTAYDEIVYDEATGKHYAYKRIGSVDMGTLNWKYNDGSSSPDKYPYGYFTFFINNIKAGTYVLTTHYIYKNSASVGFKIDKSINNAPTSKTSYLIDSSYTDADSFKASIQGQILYYELETPEVYELDFPINTSYEAYDFGTEEVLYSDDSKVNIPMKASIEYGFNAVDMIRGNYFDIQKLKKKAVTTDGGVIEGDLRVDNLIASKFVTSPTFIGNLEGRAKNADKADAITQSTASETNAPILVRGTNNTVTYNPNFTLNKFNEYLPLTGGSISGNIDMRGNEIKNTNFELVESLPTENLYEGRQITYDGKIYTYHNGKWISTADDLGDLKETLSSEFIFRPTADTHSIKDEFASVKSIKGNTVVWNQKIQTNKESENYGVIFTYSKDKITIKGTTTTNLYAGLGHSFTNKTGHKFYIKFKSNKYRDENNLNYFSTYNLIGLPSFDNDIKGIYTIYPNDYDSYGVIAVKGDGGFKEGSIVDIEVEYQLVDLTQMFGEGNEPATVEEFEKLYSHLPIDYNEGSLLNLNVDSIKSIGFNQWNEELESGYYSSKTGLPIEDNTSLRNVNPIKVFPNTKYALSVTSPNLYFYYYDNNMKYIGYVFLENKKEFQTPENCRYVNFRTQTPYGQIYKGDICISLSHNGERDGEYQSYEEHIVNLPIKKYFPDGLKSAGTVYDEIVFDKNIGKYKAIQRIGSVDMGSLNWTYNDGSSNPASYPYGFFQNSSIVRKPGRKTIKCVKYLENVDFQVDKRIAPALYQSTVYIIDSSYTDVDSLKTSLQGQILYYELAEPIETIIEDYDLVAYKANDWGTEEIISEEPTTPIKADIEYNFDAGDEIRNHIFEIKKLNKKIDELTALVESLLTTLNVNYEKVEN